MREQLIEINLTDDPEEILIPLLLSSVSCGFPSPADDYVEDAINLNKILIRHPKATVMVRAGGDSMIGRMIDIGTIILVDKMVIPKSGEAAYVRIGNEVCVRELYYDNEGHGFLLAKNENYPPIEVTEGMDVEILGKVIYSITKQ
jgi:DNA polymerase V